MENQSSSDLSKLRGNPFSPTAGADHPYLGSSFREALASVYYALEYGNRILLISADPGLGKTTLLRHLERQMRRRRRTLFVSSNSDEASNRDRTSEVLRKLLIDIGGRAVRGDLNALRIQADEMLQTLAGAENPVILLLDYNENAAGPALEIVHHLTNLESLKRGLLRVVIAVPAVVAEELQRSELVEKIERLPLAPLTASEVESYIDHRLRWGGWRGGPLFTAQAYASIVQRSAAKPSAINEICFNLLQKLFEPANDRSNSADRRQEVPLDESYIDFVISGRNRASEPLSANAALQTAPPAALLNRRAATRASMVLILVIAIIALCYRTATKAHSAGQVTTKMPSPFDTSLHRGALRDRPLAQLPKPTQAMRATGVAGKGIIAMPEARSGRGHDAVASGPSHDVSGAVAVRLSPAPGKATTFNTVAVHPTNGMPPILPSSPAIAPLKNAGEYPTEVIGKKYPNVSGAPFSPTASANRTSALSSVSSQTTAPHSGVASRLPATAEENTLPASPSAEEMADYEVRLGDAYMNLGDYDKAVLSFSKATALAPDDEEAQEKMRRARRAKAAEENVLQ